MPRRLPVLNGEVGVVPHPPPPRGGGPPHPPRAGARVPSLSQRRGKKRASTTKITLLSWFNLPLAADYFTGGGAGYFTGGGGGFFTRRGGPGAGGAFLDRW